jgi:hypothetical protein
MNIVQKKINDEKVSIVDNTLIYDEIKQEDVSSNIIFYLNDVEPTEVTLLVSNESVCSFTIYGEINLLFILQGLAGKNISIESEKNDSISIDFYVNYDEDLVI